MKKILIVGAGIEQVEAIKIAKEMGYLVITSDMNLSAPGVKYAHKAYKCSTTDIEGNILIAKNEKIDGVMTVCSETAVPTVAAVSDALNLNGFSLETAIKATNKYEMRKAFLKNNVPVSPFIVTNKYNDAFEFLQKTEGPWIIKPVDSSGQRGTYIIDDIDKLEDALNNSLNFSVSKLALIDCLVIGPEVHVTMMVINNIVHFLALSDRITLKDENFGIAVRHIGPSVISKDIEEKIMTICETAIKSIELENGVATCELILKDGEPIILEIAIRVPGGYLREVAMYLSGVDIVKTTIWNCLGEKKSFEQMITEPKHNAVSVKFITRMNIHHSVNKVNSITDYELESPNYKLCRFHHELPFSVPDLNSSVGRFGVIIAVGNSREEALKTTEEVFNNILVNDINLVEYNCYNKNNTIFN
ncbi:MAG: ATP-grasp domain-containing protein [Marinilabiliaceae bacterium]|nr:ATP-grasp domain-containing protein [Marinilabiliaceae bacterium]